MPPRRDPATMDLFDWQPPEISVGYGEEVTGKGPLDLKIARVLSRALEELREDGGPTRGEVAVKIGERLGRIVTKRHVDDWTSPAKTERRIKLDEFAAFIEVTGKHDLLGFLPALFGFAVVAERYREIIRNHEMHEQKRRVANYTAQLEAEIAASDARLKVRR